MPDTPPENAALILPVADPTNVATPLPLPTDYTDDRSEWWHEPDAR